jgi:ribosomal protein L7/L12
MTYRVRVVGWREGMQKIPVTHLLRSALGYGLAKAKQCTDDILAGKPVGFDGLAEDAAHELCRRLDELGVTVETSESG